MGNTDGRVYSFGARTGALAWATGTGAYVYASAAVADPPGLGPTVYVGSYDGNLYAFNARSGAIRWTSSGRRQDLRLVDVIGNVVYYSDLGTKTTSGLRRDHRAHGVLVPGRRVHADDRRLSRVLPDGYGTIYQLLPGRRPVAHRPPPKPTRRQVREAKHKLHRAARKRSRHQR